MTVQELIDRLREFPLDATVMVESDDGGTFDVERIFTQTALAKYNRFLKEDRLEVVIK